MMLQLRTLEHPQQVILDRRSSSSSARVQVSKTPQVAGFLYPPIYSESPRRYARIWIHESFVPGQISARSRILDSVQGSSCHRGCSPSHLQRLVAWKDLVTVLIEGSKVSEACDRREPCRLALAQALSHGIFEKLPPENSVPPSARPLLSARSRLAARLADLAIVVFICDENPCPIWLRSSLEAHFRASHFAHEVLFGVKG